MNSISKKEKEIENTKKDIDDDKISNIVEQIKIVMLKKVKDFRWLVDLIFWVKDNRNSEQDF